MQHEEKEMLTHIDARLADNAWAVLDANDRGTYTVPSPQLFPFQWNWDSPLVAMALAYRDLDRALVEMETLFKSQWDNGMVPYIIYHTPSPDYFPGPEAWGTTGTPATSGISQPPIVATCLRYIVERCVQSDDRVRERVTGLTTKIAAWHRWWHTERDPEGTGLVSLIHPWESGRDNSTDWDEPLSSFEPWIDASRHRSDTLHVNADERPTDRYYDSVLSLIDFARSVGWDDTKLLAGPFNVCDVGVQSVLVRSDTDLLWLMEYCGGSPSSRASHPLVEQGETRDADVVGL